MNHLSDNPANFDDNQKHVLYQDSLLRDVFVRNTTRQSHRSLCSLLESLDLEFQISIDGIPANLEEAIADFDLGDERLIPTIIFQIEEVKNELKHMDGPVLQELSTFILQLRRSLDPDRKRTISGILDSSDSKWLSLDEMDWRLEEE